MPPISRNSRSGHPGKHFQGFRPYRVRQAHGLRRALRRWLALGGATATAVAAVVALPATLAYAAPSTWSVAPSVNEGAASNNFNAVSCPSASFCMAVGEYVDSSGSGRTLAESWDGGSWTILDTPQPGSTGNQFNDVSCVSATDCEAVGSYLTGGGALDIVIAKWNGSTWTAQISPDPSTAENDLIGVTCLTGSNCTAVGHYDNGTTDVTLVESWNGSAWSVVSSPNKGSFTYLSDVSCVSASNCMAVGRWLASGSFTLTEKWNGSTWKIVSSPSPGGHNDAELLRVSCATSTSCVAVGDFFNGSTETLAETWNGTAWTHTTTPNPSASENNFDGVSCTSATRCVATGFTEGSGASLTLAESWNGTTWSVAAPPSPGSSNNVLLGVDCTSATNCLAVGDYTPANTNQTLAETFSTGTWSVIGSANQGGAFNSLESVSCVAANNCMAAGFSENISDVEQTLAETWNGVTWSAVPTPNQGTDNNDLNGISCATSSSCVAVGESRNGGATDALAEVWNGSTWTLTTTQNPGSAVNVLNSVACLSTTDCVAVGFQQTGAIDTTLAEMWNGSTWSVVPTPNPSSKFNDFGGISCPKPTFCAAVGSEGSGTQTKTLAATWNGTTWKATTSPNPSGTDNYFTGVSCVSNTGCQAVGEYQQSETEGLALIESWNGTKWSLATTQDPSATDNQLNGVSCFSAANCVAVGYDDQGSNTETFSDSWNGRSWTVFKPANPGAAADQLGGVSCPTAAICQATGDFAPNGTGAFQTLAETAVTLVPLIKNFTPASGKPGITVTINGDHFGGVTKVTFNGTSAKITSVSTKQLKVTVPAGATTGKIKVTSPGGTGTSATSFKVT